MILRLFLAFLKIGAVSFGGGYGMISLIRETVLKNGWLTDAQFLSFIAVSESTPGPLAVNMATFVGASQAGIWGAAAATLGVVLPAFCIILLISALLHDLLKRSGVNAFLEGIRPCVVAMILSTAVTLGLSTLFNLSALGDPIVPDVRSIVLLLLLLLFRALWKRLRKQTPSPILMILLSAGLGMILFSL